MVFYGHTHHTHGKFFFGKHLREAHSGVSSKGETQRNSTGTHFNPQDFAPNWKHRIEF